MLVMQGMYSQLGIGYPLLEVEQNIYMILRVCHASAPKLLHLLLTSFLNDRSSWHTSLFLLPQL